MSHAGVDNEVATQKLVPGNVSKPEVFDQAGSSSVAPAAERTSQGHQAVKAEAAVETPCPIKTKLNPISPGLSSVMLPLGPAPNKRRAEERNAPTKSMTEAPPAKVEPVLEAKVGSIVEFFIGRAQVRAVREDGMLELVALGWEMKREQRPRYYVRKESVKVVPTVYYKMSVLEQLHMAAWLKEEGGRLFKAAEYQAAAESYMKAIGVLKTCKFNTNADNARALEIMIPCHNNAATCYIKVKNYGDARLLSENVDTLCSALERNKGGLVMKALKDRGVGETTLLGQWWCKGLFLGGKASLYQSQNDHAVTFLKKGTKLAKSSSLSKLRNEINQELERATKRLANETKKAQKMWTKAFSKNSADTTAEEPSATRELPKFTASAQAMPQSYLQKRLEQLAREGRSSAESQKARDKDEAAEEEGEGDEEDDETQDIALPPKSLLWGTLFLGVVAVSIVGLVALGRRHFEMPLRRKRQRRLIFTSRAGLTPNPWGPHPSTRHGIHDSRTLDINTGPHQGIAETLPPTLAPSSLPREAISIPDR